MSQITIYLDQRLIDLVKRAAEDEGVSKSRWIAKTLQERLRTSWPEEVKALAGSWSDDFPEAEDLRADQVRDVPRETL